MSLYEFVERPDLESPVLILALDGWIDAGLGAANARAAVLASLTRVIVWTLATLLIIQELGFDLGPFIAGASIIGVALGFGAQIRRRRGLAHSG